MTDRTDLHEFGVHGHVEDTLLEVHAQNPHLNAAKHQNNAVNGVHVKQTKRGLLFGVSVSCRVIQISLLKHFFALRHI